MNVEQHYYQAILGFEFALAKYDYRKAIEFAEVCAANAPTPSEANRWAVRAQELELKMTRGLERIWAALGIKKEVAE